MATLPGPSGIDDYLIKAARIEELIKVLEQRAYISHEAHVTCSITTRRGGRVT